MIATVTKTTSTIRAI